MASMTRKDDRSIEDREKLAARRDQAQKNKRHGPSEEAVPMGRVMQLRRLGKEMRIA